MNTHTFTKTAALTLAAAAAFGTAAPAMAANTCKNVQLEVINDTGAKINLVDIDYWDPAKGRDGGWRSEPIPNETINDGDNWRETRNLEKVNKRSTKIRVEYRIKGRFGGWSVKKYKKNSGSFTCDARDTVSVTLD
ncbi:hypothetical protein [Erythrobacter crassostreae]|uniref:Uncharacterized protein n=1 Tax=Erythrobacter crassostreae TaxID=2828328 RepID=A0A9X1F1C8_9SPHN|nr:hypothetical protein [Erythrobacter crassostrea]MBV7258329.1 hypothetical protein [Erythrobacter crassostrea]